MSICVSIYSLQNTWISVHISAGLVLLYVNHSRVHIKGQWITNQGLVAYTSLHINGLCWCIADLATGWTMATVSSSIHVFQCIHFDGAVSAIPLPKRSIVSTQGAGWTSRYGHHNWGISFVDVARAEFSFAIPVCWLRFPSVQLVRSLQIELSSRCTMASDRSEYSVLHSVCRKHSHHATCHTREDSHTC